MCDRTVKTRYGKQALISEINEKVEELLAADYIPEVQKEKLFSEAFKVLEDGCDKIKAVTRRRQEFVIKYRINIFGDSQVSFTLPSGTSRIDLMNEAQALAYELFKHEAVSPLLLETWKKYSAFTARVSEDLERALDGNIRNSTRMTREEQEAKGWNNVDLCDLASAYVAYFIATGRDLFANNLVLARGWGMPAGDAVLSGADGLDTDAYSFDHGLRDVAAYAALPARNGKFNI